MLEQIIETASQKQFLKILVGIAGQECLISEQQNSHMEKPFGLTFSNELAAQAKGKLAISISCANGREECEKYYTDIVTIGCYKSFLNQQHLHA